MAKQEFTKEEQIQAINQVVELINKYQLNITVNHEISIVPFEKVEDTDEKE
jgi:hypothetical protein